MKGSAELLFETDFPPGLDTTAILREKSYDKER